MSAIAATAAASSTPAAPGAGHPGFVCPRCRGAVTRDVAPATDAYRCDACAVRYPVVLGIPDFRVEPDPWIDIEEDRAKALRVAHATEGADFASAVGRYWALTPTTPPRLAARFTAHVLAAERRSREWLARLSAGAPTPRPAGHWLEIGCGTGDLLAAAGDAGVPVVGVDVALRWLVIASRRAQLSSAAPPFVCCNGERLPFPDASFARVLSVGTLEHCSDAGAVVAESVRVLRPGGDVCIRTANRYSLLPEPHVGVWGVGFVPRRWADAYVRVRAGERYLHHKPLSVRELRRALRAVGLTDVAAGAAPLLDTERERLTGPARMAAPAYRWARRIPAVRQGLGWLSPLLEARGVRP